ncbi:hypothetical protein MMC31_006213 [Peltigera leucophlebia]|nr:hypothetical protein [Peltigera leucophlebia]
MFVPIRLASHSHNSQSALAEPGNAVAMVSDSSVTLYRKRKRTLEKLDLQSSLSSQSDPSSPWLLSPSLLPPCSPTLSTNQFFPSHQNQNLPSFLSATATTTSVTTKRRRVPAAARPRFRQLSTPTISSTNSAPVAPNLAPCHICHRRPTAHADLPGYSSCESCERRTCYICMRVCEGESCRSGTSTDITMTSVEFDQPQLELQNQDRSRGWELGSRNPPNNNAYARNNNENSTSSISPGSVVKGKSICGKCCVEVGADGTVWCRVCFEDDGEEDLDGGRDSVDEEGDGTGRVEQWLDGCDELA